MNTHSSLSTSSTKESRILCINFNQDQGCFAVGHENGFLVYNTNPIDLRVKRNFSHSHHSHNNNNNNTNNNANAYNTSASPTSGSGIGYITMLHRTNYLALVGGGKNPKFANNKLIIWDDLKRKNSLSLEFMSPVLNVLLSRIRIIVVLKNQVLVYGFSAPPKKFATYETIDNEFGLADLSVNSTSNSSTSSSSGKDGPKYQTLAFPGRSVGQIQLVDVSPHGQEKNLVSIIKAHKSKIRCLALNRSGTLIASASETGTLIRVHSTHNTALLYEFRRGLDRAIITSMKFSHNDSKLAVLSDKSTLHIFNIGGDSNSSNNSVQHPFNGSSVFHRGSSPESNTAPVNRQHMLKRLPIPIPIPNYFKSTWSFCSVNTNKYHADFAHSADNSNDIGVLGWSGNDSVIIIWKNKRIWERYVIVERQHAHTISSGSTDENYGRHHTDSPSSWDIVRSSWKSLDNEND
ncbi:SVP1-like protein 2 [Scheffersomyces xylosifermentans]|uniref:SVP1-like protein 2 n=1 Tax=Scheffersomyces xylosifermentans TaxID=1304137 RepID=UPI00315DD575